MPTSNRTAPVLAAALLGVLAVGGARAGIVADFSFAETSGPLKSAAAGKPVATADALADAKAYAQPGPPAGTYGEITLSDADAKALKAVHFDGKTKLDLGPAKDSPLNRTGDFTVAMWVKFDNTDGYHMVLATGAGSGNGWKAGVHDGSLALTANGVADVEADSFAVKTGQWMHVAVVVKGATGERQVTFYVDGKPVNAQPLTAESIEPSDVAHMHLGGADNSDDTDENFAGSLAGLKVFDTALDAAAVKAAALPAGK